MKKNFSKLITADLAQINAQLTAVSINSNLKEFIDQNINFIKRKLKNFVEVKKHGSYATGEIYNFDNEINVDLLAIKFVNKNMYKIYENEIETNDHFDDCWICEIKENIFSILYNFYSIDENTKVVWNEKKYYIPHLDKVVVFKDSIRIEFYKENQLGFTIIIRTSLQHNERPPLLCNKTMYKRTFTLEYIRIFRTLNKLLVKKLKILFYYLRVKFRNNLTKDERLILKINILSDIQYELVKNNYLQQWLDFSFDYHFANKKVVDDILDSKNIYYKRLKKISNFYKSFKLKNLLWVFSKTHPNTREFLNKYFDYTKEIVKNKNLLYENEFYFWYDSVAYLKNTFGSSNISIKKENKKFDDIYLPIISKTIYPTNKENGLFLVFMQFYKFEVERV